MSDSRVQRKTETTPTNDRPKVVQSSKKNVLNSYRSYTYNFTLAALRKEVVNNPDLYRQSALDFIILKSGGKGTQGISTDVSSVDRVTGQEEYEVEETEDVPIREGGRITGYNKEKVRKKRKRDVFSKDDITGKELVKSFNEKSPGRFDLYIDNVEIETTMAFSQEGGTTLPTAFRFRVFEPYSINGFIEALHVSAVAAGYPNYTEASFILKMDFIGYPDNDTVSFQSPKIIENTTRYFPIKFTGIDVEIGERGTRYSCSAIPYSDSAFGQANKLKRPITMAGNTVEEVLKNFVSNLNEQIKNDENLAKVGAKDFDEYEILFPLREDGFNRNVTNEIGKSNITSILKTNSIYKFPDPGRSQPSQTPRQSDAAPDEIKLHPNSGTPPQIQFSDGQNINEIIAAVIRDSEYVKNILREKKIDSNGFIDYFMIKADVTNKETIDPVSRKPFQIYTYNVLPYKIHFTRIPSLQGQKFDASDITSLSLREYNYIYTGKNVDVINFKLSFNKLFFEAIPVAMGNNDQPGARDSVAQPNDVRERLKGTDMVNETTDQNGSPTQRSVSQSVIMNGANAGQMSNDPYYTLARNMHNAIIDSKASMVTGEIEIIGDPFFLVTGGIGNYNPKPGELSGTTTDGEADHMQGEVLITINFRNPVDINPLQKGGLLYFETEKLPFSGVYRVIRVHNTFNDGFFKQRLEIVRYPGQIIGKTKETVLADATSEEPKPGAQVVQSTTLGENRGGTAISTVNAATALGRGLPSSGLPGFLSNFIGQQGGLGGVGNLLNQFSGIAAKGLGALGSANSVLGANNPINLDQLSAGIRMKTSGLFDAVSAGLGNAAALVKSSAAINSVLPTNSSAETLADNIVKQQNAIANQIGVEGSGIGEGAKYSVNVLTSSDGNPVVTSDGTPVSVGNSSSLNLDVKSTDLKASVGLSSVAGVASGLLPTDISAVKSLGANVSGLISSVGGKIQGLTSGVPSDPNAIAAKFGINPSQLSGLSDNMRSKVLNDLTDLSKKIPKDANLDLATSRGLMLKYVPKDKLQNLPATAPYRTAPPPEYDEKYLQELASQGSQKLANAFGVSNPSSLNDDLKESSAFQNLASMSSLLPDGLKAGLGDTNALDVNAIRNKLTGASNLINTVSPIEGSVESNLKSIQNKIGNSFQTTNLATSVVTKFNQGPSPLDKLLNT
jgi:hypothetical protein